MHLLLNIDKKMKFKQRLLVSTNTRLHVCDVMTLRQHYDGKLRFIAIHSAQIVTQTAGITNTEYFTCKLHPNQKEFVVLLFWLRTHVRFYFKNVCGAIKNSEPKCKWALSYPNHL